MMRAMGAAAVAVFLLGACAAPPPDGYDGKRSPKWGSAIVTGGSVRGGGAGS